MIRSLVASIGEWIFAVGLILLVAVIMVFGVILAILKVVFRLLWSALYKLGQGIGWLWSNHRGWLFSGTACAAILALAVPLVRGASIAPAAVGLIVAKVIGGLIWAAVIIGIGIALLKRYWHLRMTLLVILGSLAALGAAVAVCLWSAQLYAKNSPFWWLPGAILLLLATAAGIWLWQSRRPTTAAPGPTGTTPVRSSRPGCRKRNGPPALIVIMIIALDLWVLVTQVTSPGWNFPFFHWPTTAMWLRAWPLWGVIFLTAITFFADWGEENRPNGVRKAASNLVSIGFLFALVAVAVMGLFFVVQHIRW